MKTTFSTLGEHFPVNAFWFSSKILFVIRAVKDAHSKICAFINILRHQVLFSTLHHIGYGVCWCSFLRFIQNEIFVCGVQPFVVEQEKCLLLFIFIFNSFHIFIWHEVLEETGHAGRIFQRIIENCDSMKLNQNSNECNSMKLRETN